MTTSSTDATSNRKTTESETETDREHQARKKYILHLCWHTDTLPPRSLDQYIHWEMTAAIPPNEDAPVAGYIVSCQKKLDEHPFTAKLKALEEKHGDEFTDVPLTAKAV